ncbi:MAG: response regulator [Candidatus Riflebacteria bacterium]|nr:response regulator [Candidatus Riflebacteria bacterium]
MKKTVLVIEDSSEIMESLVDIIDAAGYEVISAVNGREGIEKALEFQPDVIISDIIMPEIDGYGVFNELKKHPKTMVVPFLFLSACREPDDIRKGMTLGADDYIPKPVSATELLEAIRTRIAKTDGIKQWVDDFVKYVVTENMPQEFGFPLQKINTAAILLKNQPMSYQRVKEHAETIFSAGNTLLKLIENFMVSRKLHISEITSHAPSSSVELVRQKLDSHFEKNQKYGKIEFDLQSGVLGLPQPELLKIFCALTENALKYSGQTFPIKISGRFDGEIYILRVSYLVEPEAKISNTALPSDKISGNNSKQQVVSEYPERYDKYSLATVMLIAEKYGGQLLVTHESDSSEAISVFLPIARPFTRNSVD